MQKVYGYITQERISQLNEVGWQIFVLAHIHFTENKTFFVILNQVNFSRFFYIFFFTFSFTFTMNL